MLIPNTAQRIVRLVLLLFLILTLASSAAAADISGAVIMRVPDGDTLVLSNGERIRLLGLDAPERGEAFSEEARERLLELTLGKEVKFEACSQRDQYGRILALARTGEVNINMVLLEEGLAVPMLIPPCGKMVASQVLGAAEGALVAGKGIYVQPEYQVVDHDEAGEYIGKRVVVAGKVIALHKGAKAWHLNFGDDWRTDFTAVLFRPGRSRFDALGLDPEDLVGSQVLVIGRVKSYNGPEIIINGPDQIIPAR